MDMRMKTELFERQSELLYLKAMTKVTEIVILRYCSGV